MNDKTRILQCPHCEIGINVKCDWMCGWCGHENQHEDRRFIPSARPNALAGCDSCDKRAIAIHCPYCDNDIVLDIPAYDRAPEQGFGKRGTAISLTG